MTPLTPRPVVGGGAPAWHTRTHTQGFCAQLRPQAFAGLGLAGAQRLSNVAEQAFRLMNRHRFRVGQLLWWDTGLYFLFLNEIRNCEGALGLVYSLAALRRTNHHR